MITKEVNDWIKNVKLHKYSSYYDAIEEFSGFVRYLTKDELIRIKRILESEYK